ncbi:MAG: acetyl-CoA C-acyltransferase [Denitrovibrio sp.]|nr:MAG: acetyl-CoA C-acyltransferase [Denitrovibrio sp.]
MKNVYIVEALRTPFGSFGGSLSDVPATLLAATAMKSVLEKSGMPPEAVDEVILGQVIQGGVGQAPARIAMRSAGLPDKTHAITINKVCGSGLKSVMLGVQSILLGDSSVVMAGCMENMSAAPYAMFRARDGFRMGNGEVVDLMLHDALLDPYSGLHMGVITEAANEKYGITREEQDEYAVRSYTLASKAVSEGIFDYEVSPVVKKTRKGDVVVDKDEEPGRGKIEKITTLSPVFKKDGGITAGNASSINDGACAVLVADDASVQKYGLTPKAKIIAYTTNSIHPDDFGQAPVGAIKKLLEKAEMSVNDIDLFEINEAFSSVPVIAARECGLNIDRLNVNGGAVALGHPVGASGARLITTLVRELKLRNKKYGVASLCIGGGEAVAMLIERV